LFINIEAAVHAFQAAVANPVLDKVIVAEIEEGGAEHGPISLAANAAFDAGAVVVAANGNFGPNPGSVSEPASASRVLGVGDFDVSDVTGSPSFTQGRGPTVDKRIKPDVQAPTNTETASNGCVRHKDCRRYQNDGAILRFDATSGATPYAAGAAALLRNLVASARRTNDVEPGIVYALMILSGQKADIKKLDNSNDRGAGPLRLPTNGTLFWGAVSVKEGETIGVPIPIHVPSPQRILDAALWWPEDAGSHNDIDLSIVDPKGVERAASRSVPSVFERARFQGSMNDIWHIRIEGRSFFPGSGPQKVYFAILSQPEP
jgi:subtilisin family serine protease